MAKKVFISVLVESSLVDKIKVKVAEFKYSTRSDIIREAIELGLEQIGKDKVKKLDALDD